MQSGEGQRVGGCVQDRLGAQAMGIIDVIRDEQTGVRVKVHAGLVALLFPRQQDQIGQNLVAKNSPPPSRSVGPANRAFASGRRFHFQRRFQLVDALEEFPTLPWRQGLHVLQYFIRAHGRKLPRTGRAAQVRFWQLTTDHWPGTVSHEFWMMNRNRAKAGLSPVENKNPGGLSHPLLWSTESRLCTSQRR